MSGIAVHVESVGKQYRIGRVRPNPTMLREAASAWAQAAARTVLSPLRQARERRGGTESFWALHNVSFEVERGETLGIIGRNGAGKSTLLKILSRITDPTNGSIWIRGRVGSLLEVGTGFHPELTGRENVYLNGAILGMKRGEIDRKFDEIVAFSEVERFVDTQVKHYSSGMYLRLGFSVAAHLEPEVLVIDEVLAVGDAAFQRRCLGKMAEVSREGRTVLFVSHNLAAVQNLCTRALLLSDGTIAAQGPAADVISEYLLGVEQGLSGSLEDRTDRKGRGETKLLDVEITTGDQMMPSGMLAVGVPARFKFSTNGVGAELSIWFTIYDQQSAPVCSFYSHFQGPDDKVDTSLGSTLICEVPELLLVPGHYHVNVGLYTHHELQDDVEYAAAFEVLEGTLRGRRVATHSGVGNVRLPHRWILPAEISDGN